LSDVPRTTAAIASGDTEAFARLYEERFDEVYAFVRSLTRLDEADCLDIVQEAMMRVIRKMKRLDNEPALRAWLRRVARSAAYDHLRRERRRRRRERALEPADGDSAASGLAVEIAERADWLRTELSGLDRATSDLLHLRYCAGMTLERIGYRVGLTPGAVDGRLRRTLASLRSAANEQEENGDAA